MHIFKVTMSKSGCVFLVAADDEAVAARAAEMRWKEWGYLSGVKAVTVELVGFGGQYPPDTGGSTSNVPWFISARAALGGDDE